MGHRKKNAPRRGSLAYLPKRRSARAIGRIRFWPEVKTGPCLLGFMGYKAGMTHIFVVEDHAGSPNFGKEVVQPATVIDMPPIMVCAIRVYGKNHNGDLQTFTEAWMKDPPKELDRCMTLPENFDPEKGLKKIEENLDKIAELRLLAITQPKLAGIPKKKPDAMEIKVGGGEIKGQFEYAKNLLGKTVSINEVFKDGQYVDIIGVSKGKGFQGTVKRWGVKILPRKSRKTKRGIAVQGPWNPSHILYTVPRSGQMGYHQRTEYNKRILKIGADGKEVSPKGGFLHYGLIRGSYILLNGSIFGPPKRLIRLRHPARPPRRVPEAPPTLVHVSLESKRGK